MSLSADYQYEEDKSEEEEENSYQINSINTQAEHQINEVSLIKPNITNVFTENQKHFFYNQCQKILDQIMKFENSYFFFQPVDPEKENAPDYYRIIAQPMSIYNVQQKIDQLQYQTPEEFINDMRLIWSNAKLYNPPMHPVYKAADDLSFKFELMAATLPHVVDDQSLNGGFQREVELRFARYRLMKKSHL